MCVVVASTSYAEFVYPGGNFPTSHVWSFVLGCHRWYCRFRVQDAVVGTVDLEFSTFVTRNGLCIPFANFSSTSTLTFIMVSTIANIHEATRNVPVTSVHWSSDRIETENPTSSFPMSIWYQRRCFSVSPVCDGRRISSVTRYLPHTHAKHLEIAISVIT